MVLRFLIVNYLISVRIDVPCYLFRFMWIYLVLNRFVYMYGPDMAMVTMWRALGGGKGGGVQVESVGVSCGSGAEDWGDPFGGSVCVCVCVVYVPPPFQAKPRVTSTDTHTHPHRTTTPPPPPGNGYPVGGVVMGRRAADAFCRGGMEYFNT